MGKARKAEKSGEDLPGRGESNSERWPCQETRRWRVGMGRPGEASGGMRRGRNQPAAGNTGGENGPPASTPHRQGPRREAWSQRTDFCWSRE